MNKYIENEKSGYYSIITYSNEKDALLCSYCITYGDSKSKINFADAAIGSKTFTLDNLKNYFETITHKKAREAFIVKKQKNTARDIIAKQNEDILEEIAEILFKLQLKCLIYLMMPIC